MHLQENEIYSVVPGENKHPVSFLMDKQCEELTFPVLFPKADMVTLQKERLS